MTASKILLFGSKIVLHVLLAQSHSQSLSFPWSRRRVCFSFSHLLLVPGSLFFPSPSPGGKAEKGKEKHPGNEVAFSIQGNQEQLQNSGPCRASTNKLIRSFSRTRHKIIAGYVIQRYGSEWSCIL